MIRRPPRSTRTEHSFPTRRSSDLIFPCSVRVERSRDTHRLSAGPDGHLDFARCERIQERLRPLPPLPALPFAAFSPPAPAPPAALPSRSTPPRPAATISPRPQPGRESRGASRWTYVSFWLATRTAKTK